MVAQSPSFYLFSDSDWITPYGTLNKVGYVNFAIFDQLSGYNMWETIPDRAIVTMEQ